MAVRYVCDGCGDEFNGGVEIFSMPFPKESSDPIPFLASKHLCMPCHAFVFELGKLGVIGEARKKPPAAGHPMQGIVDAAKRVVGDYCQCEKPNLTWRSDCKGNWHFDSCLDCAKCVRLSQ